MGVSDSPPRGDQAKKVGVSTFLYTCKESPVFAPWCQLLSSKCPSGGIEGNSVQLDGPPDDCAVQGMQPAPWAHSLELQKPARRAQAVAERPGLVTQQKRGAPHRPQRPLWVRPAGRASPPRAQRGLPGVAAACGSLLPADRRVGRGGHAAVLVVKGRAEGRELCICAALATASMGCSVLFP